MIARLRVVSPQVVPSVLPFRHPADCGCFCRACVSRGRRLTSMDDAGLGVLAKIGAERPRLMATKAAIERAQHNLRHNDTARQWSEEVEKQANLLLDLPPLTSSWVHDPRETGAAPLPLVRPPKSTDAPAAPLDIARLFCLRIQTLGIIWLLTGDTRYRDRAKAELLAVCAFPDWAAGYKFWSRPRLRSEPRSAMIGCTTALIPVSAGRSRARSSTKPSSRASINSPSRSRRTGPQRR